MAQSTRIPAHYSSIWKHLPFSDDRNKTNLHELFGPNPPPRDHRAGRPGSGLRRRDPRQRRPG